MGSRNSVKTRHYIACDLGAESGRVMLGTFDGTTLRLEEAHRFSNAGVEAGGLRWDVSKIFEEIKTGLRTIARQGITADSISCDSWGVDYVLIGDDGTPLEMPFHYRDRRTHEAMEQALSVVPREDIFRETGIQFMPINTLYQLYDDRVNRSSVLQSATRFLTIADYFHYLLSGIGSVEESLASTTQIYNPRTKDWSSSLIKAFGFPQSIFPRLVPSGTILGTLLDDVRQETGLGPCSVVAGMSHDTAAAVAAVPAQGRDWAYLSSGTWSLIGVEMSAPVINDKSLEYNFTNEVGFGGTIRLLKNIPGMWIVQECKRAWTAKGEELSYEALAKLAEDAGPARDLIDPMDQRFAHPKDMTSEIADYCRERNLFVPDTSGAMIRCVLESLARSYREKIGQLEELIGRDIRTLHIVGGGSKNRLLNQLAADAVGRTVYAGPVECSAIGNVIAQAITLGHIPSLEAARSAVSSSFSVERYIPEPKNNKTRRQ